MVIGSGKSRYCLSKKMLEISSQLLPSGQVLTLYYWLPTAVFTLLFPCAGGALEYIAPLCVRSLPGQILILSYETN